jgi:hypothetical protein
LLTSQFGQSVLARLLVQNKLKKSTTRSEDGSRRTFLLKLLKRPEFFMEDQSQRRTLLNLFRNKILMGSLLEVLHLKKHSLILSKLAMISRNESDSIS